MNERSSSYRAGLFTAAVVYTFVGFAQRAGAFLLLPFLTRSMSTADFGRVSLLTTVSSLLQNMLVFGLEPRIIQESFRRSGPSLAGYLRAARVVALVGPVLFSLVADVSVWVLRVPERTTWIAEITGTALLVSGTTFTYAVLRAQRRARLYAVIGLFVLVTQLTSRIMLVAVLREGPAGWAAADLVTGVLVFGLVAAIQGPARLIAADRNRKSGRTSPLVPFIEGLPLIAHYVNAWILALSDRVILAFIAGVAAVGRYSAVYQFVSAVSLVMSEVNRALMPSYANSERHSARLKTLVAGQIALSVAVYGAVSGASFFAMRIILPPSYQDDVRILPWLALGGLGYSLYFIPMNSITLIRGRRQAAPLISGAGAGLNVALNLVLDQFFGLWGAALATFAGYLALFGVAAAVERKQSNVEWHASLRVLRRILLPCLLITILPLVFIVNQVFLSGSVAVILLMGSLAVALAGAKDIVKSRANL